MFANRRGTRKTIVSSVTDDCGSNRSKPKKTKCVLDDIKWIGFDKVDVIAVFAVIVLLSVLISTAIVSSINLTKESEKNGFHQQLPDKVQIQNWYWNFDSGSVSFSNDGTAVIPDFKNHSGLVYCHYRFNTDHSFVATFLNKSTETIQFKINSDQERLILIDRNGSVLESEPLGAPEY